MNPIEEERDKALKRVAELERQLDGKALPQDQDALEKTRKDLEAEKASHARARKELEEKIKRLEQQLAEKDKARGQGVDGAKDKYEEEPIGKGRGSYLAMIDALTKAISVKDRDLASWLEAKIAAIGYDGPKAQAIRNILNDVAAHRKKKIGR